MAESLSVDRVEEIRDYHRGGPGDNNWLCECGMFCHRERDDLLADHDRLQRENAELRTAMAVFRDDVLHQRGPLAENGMTSEQVNDVLNCLDATLANPSTTPSV